MKTLGALTLALALAGCAGHATAHTPTITDTPHATPTLPSPSR